MVLIERKSTLHKGGCCLDAITDILLIFFLVRFNIK